MGFYEKKISGETKYTGIIVNVRTDIAELDNGHRVPREVVEHPGGVTIVPIDRQGRVIMVRQFRYPMDCELLEVPAGKLERGEDPRECAVRELSEETGFTAEEFIDLGPMYPSPGFCDEVLYTYLALGLTEGEAHPDEDEFLSLERVPLDEVCEMIMRNEIPDGKTVYGVMKAKMYLDRREG